MIRHVLDGLLVAVALASSATYAALALGPKGLRRRMAEGIARAAASTPALFGLRGRVLRLSSNIGKKGQGACGGCDDCGTARGAESRSSGAEARVPLAHIGRRGAG